MLFKTVHGSHLYGLAHSGSDQDFYVVIETLRNRRARYAKQSIVDGVDTTTVDFGTWVNMCQAGVPQALEAMFSTKPLVDEISDFRKAFRMGESARDKYHRTIDNFLGDDFKKNRHALRLALNLRDGMRYGRFNPTLRNGDAVYITYVAKYLSPEDIREKAFEIAYNH